MTYQRNKWFPLRRPWALQDGLDEGLPQGTEQPQIAPGDHDEAQHDRGALADVTAVGPLHALELGPGRGEEGDDARHQPSAMGRLDLFAASGGLGLRLRHRPARDG